MSRPTFTIEQGKQVQKDDMKHWKMLLSERAYYHLERILVEREAQTTYLTGYDVIRGVDIDMLVNNEVWKAMYQKQDNKS